MLKDILRCLPVVEIGLYCLGGDRRCCASSPRFMVVEKSVVYRWKAACTVMMNGIWMVLVVDMSETGAKGQKVKLVASNLFHPTH